MKYFAWIIRLPLVSKEFKERVARKAKENGMAVGEYVTAVLEQHVGAMPVVAERKRANAKGNV